LLEQTWVRILGLYVGCKVRFKKQDKPVCVLGAPREFSVPADAILTITGFHVDTMGGQYVWLKYKNKQSFLDKYDEVEAI